MQPIEPLDQNKTFHEFQYDRSVSRVFHNISFGWKTPALSTPYLDNMKGAWWTGTTPSGGTEFTIQHNLGYIPVGYLVIRSNAAVTLYDGVTAWTKTNIYLKASVGSVNVTVFVLG